MSENDKKDSRRLGAKGKVSLVGNIIVAPVLSGPSLGQECSASYSNRHGHVAGAASVPKLADR
jgi:hypothetical protein